MSEVTVARNQDVVVAGRMEHGVPVVVLGDTEVTGALSDRVEEEGWKVVIVKVDDHSVGPVGPREGDSVLPNPVNVQRDGYRRPPPTLEDTLPHLVPLQATR